VPKCKELQLGKTNTLFIDGDRSSRYPKREEFVESGIIFLNSESIKNGFIDISSVNFVGEQKYSEIKKGRLKKRDILLTTRGNGVGNVAFVNIEERGLINAQMLILRAFPSEIHPKFLYFYLTTKTLQSYISNFASGAAQPQIPIRDLRKIPIICPDLNNQKKIAAILSAYDDLIENNKRRIALLEKMAEEIYREWFVRFRFPGHDTVKFVKGVPVGWEQKSCIEIFNVLSGGTPKTDMAVFWDGDIPFFTPRDAKDNIYALNTEKNITEKGLTACNSQLFNKDTIFITARGTVGNVVLSYRDMAMNQSCYALLPKENQKIHFYFFTIKNAISYIKGVSKSGVFDNIIIDTFKIIPLWYPQAKLITEFNERVGPLVDNIGILLEANENLGRTRDRLLPRLISGKLSVENLDIHFPASMLEETPQP
jgi:type I restriction enzyme, S subunit